MKVEEMKRQKPMRYNEVKPTESEAQKNKLKKKIENGDYIATLKRDGAWYRFIKDSNGDSILQGRTISKKTGEHTEKHENVPHIMTALNSLPSGTVLIGEICYPKDMKDMVSSDVTKIMGCLPKKAIERQEKVKMHYLIFDVLAYDDEPVYNKPYSERMTILESIKQKYAFSEYIEFPELVTENIEEQIAEWLAEGYEGGMLMDKSQPYFFEKRPKWVSVKFKQFLQDDLDLVLMDFTPPTRKYTGKNPSSWYYWENYKTGEKVEGYYHNNPDFEAVSQNYFENLIGGFKLGLYKPNGELIEVARISNLTDDIRLDATHKPEKYLNRVVKVNAMSIDTEKRSLRHPKMVGFHDGKDKTECLFTEVF